MILKKLLYTSNIQKAVPQQIFSISDWSRAVVGKSTYHVRKLILFFYYYPSMILHAR